MSDYTRTPQQRAIVGHPLVPLRVAAGAGTGKTATVTDRLVSLIEMGTPPEAALGITFTNKAAEELADRLRSALPELAREGREVEVTTYHGFAYGVLQEFGALVGIERDTQVIGPGYVRQLLFESLGDASYAHLDLAAAPQRVAEAATLASQLGDNLVPVSRLLGTEYSEAPEPWPARRELAGIVGRYEELKRELQVVDYADLILFSHHLVVDHPLVAKRIRERYHCVVLDEYQDTAPAQRELFRHLFADGFPLTAVGDSDQTIYEWRGASQENFDGFPAHFPATDGTPAATLPLTINHRSDGRILELAHAVRERIHAPGTFPRLAAAAAAGEGSVEARWFRTAVDEATWIAAEIKRLHDEEQIAWSDMAVLFRKNRQIPLIRDACALVGIPLEVASLGGLLDVPEVADLAAWLRLLHHRDDTVALARILLGSRYRLGLGDLAVLASWARQQGLWSDDEEGPSWPLLEAVDRLDEIEQLEEEPRRRLGEFRDLYRSLLTQAQGLALVELCRRILDAFDAWAEVEAMGPAAALTVRLNLYRFLDLAQEWSPLEGRPSLDAFLGYLELLQTDPAADELDTARVGGADAVALLTVHRAKGLEWDTVFLPALADGIFPARSLGHDNPVAQARYLPFELRLDADALPNLDIAKPLRDEALQGRHLAGEWRTAYVAVTRARHRLFLSGAFWYEGKRPRKPSDLFDIAARSPAVAVPLLADEPGDRPERLALEDTTSGPDPVFPETWKQALLATLGDPEWPLKLVDDRTTYDEQVDQLRMTVDGMAADRTPSEDPPVPALSVTGLVTLAACPLRFYWSEVDRLPRRPSAALKRGVEVHRKIELHNRGSISFDDLDEDLYDAPAATTGDTTDRRNPFDVFLSSRFANRTPLFIETPIDLKVGGTRVRGRIDAVYQADDGSWEIVDYKSGRHREDTSALVQLEAYAVAAVEGAVAPERPDSLSVTFLYLGGDRPEEVTRTADDVWLQEASTHLESLVSRAGGPDYAATPSAQCNHCDFLRFCDAGRAHVAGD
jgi:DNA helicase-2/ATP-dependent DNA helicase PcrA